MASLTEIGTAQHSAAAQAVTATVVSPGAAAGQLVLVKVAASGAGTFGTTDVTDSKGNTYVRDSYGTWGSTDGRSAVFASVIATALVSGDTVRFDNNGTSFKIIWVGVLDTPGATPLDQSASASGTGTSMASGSTGVTVQAIELVFANFSWTGTDAFTPPAGYSQPTTPKQSTSGATLRSQAIAYKFVSSTGTQSATGTIAGSENWRASVLTYKVTAAPTVPQKMRARLVDSRGNWTKEDGSSSGLPASINEPVASDSDYVKSSLHPVNDTLGVWLDAANAPQAGSFILKTRYQKDTSPGSEQIDLVVKLYNDNTLILTRTFTNIGTIVEDDYTLSGAEVTACGNLDKLRVEMIANAV